MTEIRKDLPPLPAQFDGLPVDARGYPVPWFASWHHGGPDFVAVDPGKIATAIRFNVCWLCGHKLGERKAFVIGPMCAINRVSAEPPQHPECAIFAACACPLLSRPSARRRPHEGPFTGAGFMIERNPGVALGWISRNAEPFEVEGGVLHDVGDPVDVTWWREGRPATRAEVEHSIETGLPLLRQAAEQDGPEALADLGRRILAMHRLLPAPEAA